MSGPLQTFLAGATTKSANDLIVLIDGMPEAQRSWSPLDKGRTALDQAAECAIINGAMVKLIETKTFPSTFSMEQFNSTKADLAKDWASLKSLLQSNTSAAIAAIESVPDSDFGIEIDLPWGKSTVLQLLSMPFWNMSYHQGQITYITVLAE